MEFMGLLVAATLLLIAGHLVPSAPGVRDRLIAGLGRGGFYASYSLLSLLALLLVVWSYRAVGPSDWWYAPAPEARLLAVALMPVALLLLVARLTTKAEAEHGPRGIYRVTTVPGSLAVLLWTVLHLLNLGEARSVVVFAAMAAIAAASLAKNARLARRRWPQAAALPFAAILRGSERLVWREIGWWRIALAIGAYLALLHLHPLVIGRDPLAGL